MNPYLEKISDLSYRNKYTTWYINIISNSLKKYKNKADAKCNLGPNCIAHHILPKSFNLGGEKDISNIAFLTIREHFIVHLLLPKMIKDDRQARKIASAITKMNVHGQINSKTYELGVKISIKYSINKSPETRSKTKETLYQKYGVTHNSQLPDHFEKVKRTNNINYGYDWASQNPDVKEKVKLAHQQKYNVDHPSMLQETQEKKKQTNIRKRGVENVSQDPIIKNKIKQTNMQKRGVENVSQDPSLKDKISNSIKESWKDREMIECPYCHCKSNNASRMVQYHFNNCKSSPSYIKPKSIICPCCLKEGLDTFQFRKHHFEFCSKSPNYTPNLISCPHCNKIGNKANMIQWHFDKCKFKK